MNYTDFLVLYEMALGDNARKVLQTKQTTDDFGGQDMANDHNKWLSNNANRIRGRIRKNLMGSRYEDETNRYSAAQAASNRLGDRELGSIAAYTNDIHRPLNQIMRGQELSRQDSGLENVSAIKDVAQNLYRGLKSLPKQEGNFYRGIASSRVREMLEQLKVGDEIEDQGFGSYSSSLGAAKSFFGSDSSKNAMIQLAGNRFRDVAPFSQVEDEEELMTLPGIRMKLREIQHHPRSKYDEELIPHYLFDLLDEEEEDL